MHGVCAHVRNTGIPCAGGADEGDSSDICAGHLVLRHHLHVRPVEEIPSVLPEVESQRVLRTHGVLLLLRIRNHDERTGRNEQKGREHTLCATRASARIVRSQSLGRVDGRCRDGPAHEDA